MADYEATTTTSTASHQHHNVIPKETALQALNTIIQLHFEKTLEKKRAVDLQKKELWKLFQIFFLFLGLVFLAQSQSTSLQCRHCWVPIGLLSLAHLIFYVSVAQTMRLRQLRMRISSGGNPNYVDETGEDFEIHYQEPPESYFGKFKRNWALHFGFLILIYGFMVSSSVVLLCF
ncbi:unnamed protein product [Fraxinus pennsylvanica]|uniref:Transmembrane protein n=1 Tax=Fraxinus pennsylvanica TaxID=56036 RepID=A0AAD2A3Y1_9LAMI|nr:unnamed protein product [Fraxinus pennsylvanica]